MPRHAAFQEVFTRLKGLLLPYAARLRVAADKPTNYCLEAPASVRFPKGLFFGATRLGKAYVSYYLMAVYMYPELLDSISPELRARMQGKSCFNFKTLDATLCKELGGLTKKSFAHYRKRNLV